jgi:hypothetical protein
MAIRIKLVGCNRYSYKGELFEKGFEYDLDDAKARALLVSNDDYGRPFFVRVEVPAELDQEVIIEREESEEIAGAKITRKVGRPRKNPIVKTSGDTAPLRDDGEDRKIPVVQGEGVEV